MQRGMVNLRLGLLDAYLLPGSTELKSYFGAGQMVLVDLTDPFLDGMRCFSKIKRELTAKRNHRLRSV